MKKKGFSLAHSIWSVRVSENYEFAQGGGVAGES
jgi:hypothetical protein